MSERVAHRSKRGETVSQRSKEVLPIVDYFRQARNRIIHQQGVASSELSSLSRSTELADARRALNAQLRRASPELPEFAVGDVVAFAHRHAIFFKIVVGRVFREFCNQLRPKLTEDGFLRMATHYSLGTATHPYRGPRHHHAVTAVKRFLYDRYRVSALDDAKIIKRCQELGLWTEVSDRFNAIYGSGQ